MWAQSAPPNLVKRQPVLRRKEPEVHVSTGVVYRPSRCFGMLSFIYCFKSALRISGLPLTIFLTIGQRLFHAAAGSLINWQAASNFFLRKTRSIICEARRLSPAPEKSRSGPERAKKKPLKHQTFLLPRVRSRGTCPDCQPTVSASLIVMMR